MMKKAHCLFVVACAGACASIAMADLPKTTPGPKIQTATLTTQPYEVTTVTNVLTGQTVRPSGVGARGPVIGFDNLNLPGSAASLNVAYVQPGSYNGSDPSTSASLFGLGNGPAGSALRAPSNATFPNPTHIVWNDYVGDANVWPGGAGANAGCTEFDISVALDSRNQPAHVDTLRVLFFSPDGLTVVGGFQVGINTPANAFTYGRLNVDLSALNPPVLAPQEGLVMVDYIPVEGQTTIAGVGLSFAGGDLANTNYPTPDSLVQVGTSFPATWAFTDGILGDAEHPMGPDPLFDMVEGLGYVNLFNTGVLVNWGFTATTPGGAIGTRTFAHDFPMLMMVGTPPPAVATCIFVEQQNCFLSLEADCLAAGGVFHPEILDCGNPGACCLPAGCTFASFQAICLVQGGTFPEDFLPCESANCPTPPSCPCNFNNDGFVNSQDFFDFIACFFTPTCAAADFNQDTFVNSQDFFDFLVCFFAPPTGCP